MTALSANRETAVKSAGNVKAYLMKASTTIYAGSMVALDTNGLAVPAADTVGFKGVVGVAMDKVVSAASGDYFIKVQEGLFLLAGSSLAQARQGELVYVGDDQTVVLSPGSTSLVRAGVLVEYVGASSGWVLIGPAVPKPRFCLHQTYINLASITAAGDVVTSFTPGFSGRIRSLQFHTMVPVTTGSRLLTLNAEINTTDTTGGLVALTSATCTPLGAVIAGSAVTAANLFDENDTISVEASSVTAFAEGTGTLTIVLEQF